MSYVDKIKVGGNTYYFKDASAMAVSSRDPETFIEGSLPVDSANILSIAGNAKDGFALVAKADSTTYTFYRSSDGTVWERIEEEKYVIHPERTDADICLNTDNGLHKASGVCINGNFTFLVFEKYTNDSSSESPSEAYCVGRTFCIEAASTTIGDMDPWVVGGAEYNNVQIAKSFYDPVTNTIVGMISCRYQDNISKLSIFKIQLTEDGLYSGITRLSGDEPNPLESGILEYGFCSIDYCPSTSEVIWVDFDDNYTIDGIGFALRCINIATGNKRLTYWENFAIRGEYEEVLPQCYLGSHTDTEYVLGYMNFDHEHEDNPESYIGCTKNGTDTSFSKENICIELGNFGLLKGHRDGILLVSKDSNMHYEPMFISKNSKKIIRLDAVSPLSDPHVAVCTNDSYIFIAIDSEDEYRNPLSLVKYYSAIEDDFIEINRESGEAASLTSNYVLQATNDCIFYQTDYSGTVKIFTGFKPNGLIYNGKDVTKIVGESMSPYINNLDGSHIVNLNLDGSHIVSGTVAVDINNINTKTIDFTTETLKIDNTQGTDECNVIDVSIQPTEVGAGRSWLKADHSNTFLGVTTGASGEAWQNKLYNGFYAGYGADAPSQGTFYYVNGVKHKFPNSDIIGGKDLGDDGQQINTNLIIGDFDGNKSTLGITDGILTRVCLGISSTGDRISLNEYIGDSGWVSRYVGPQLYLHSIRMQDRWISNYYFYGTLYVLSTSAISWTAANLPSSFESHFNDTSDSHAIVGINGVLGTLTSGTLTYDKHICGLADGFGSSLYYKSTSSTDTGAPSTLSFVNWSLDKTPGTVMDTVIPLA